MKYTKFFTLLVLFSFWFGAIAAQDPSHKRIKNLIVMIPDGTSLATVSMARWLQFYRNPAEPKLYIDPYICGTVRTTSSNAPIGDSAPTTSCYMTGHPSRTGYVATYPVADGNNDIYPMDSTKAYQPMVTLLEALKMLAQKAAGLVVTCEFPHATPADCSAHSYARGRYDWIVPQMVHNGLSVLLGGGVSLLTPELESSLKSQGVTLHKNDLAGMRKDNGTKIWALFGDKSMDYDIDRDPNEQPSLEEMTRKAISTLSQDEHGFFLMVEGSKVDWGAHANDPIAMATEMLAFDRACGAALEFAKNDGQTAVVILPDHGNSGISIGRSGTGAYDKLTKDQLFKQFSQYTLTAEGLAHKINNAPYDSLRPLFARYAGLQLSDTEVKAITHCKDYQSSPLPVAQRDSKAVPSLYSSSLAGVIAKVYTKHTCFGFTTGGHTGEDVFLAAYHPYGYLPMGMHTNVEINHYLCELTGMEGKLDSLTNVCFAPHRDVFKSYVCSLVSAKGDKQPPILTVQNPKTRTVLTIKPFSNQVVVKRKEKEQQVCLNSVVVYVDKTNTFYLPRTLRALLQ